MISEVVCYGVEKEYLKYQSSLDGLNAVQSNQSIHQSINPSIHQLYPTQSRNLRTFHNSPAKMRFTTTAASVFLYALVGLSSGMLIVVTTSCIN